MASPRSNVIELPVRKVQGYGWRRDIPDPRDFQSTFSSSAMSKTYKPIDFRDSGHLFDPYDQEQLGSCTANEAAGALEYLMNKEGLPSYTPSRLFIYYQERVLEGTVGQDSGAQIRDSAKVCNVLGAPPETEWPYDISKFAEKPPIGSYTDALKDVLLQYVRVQPDEQHFKAILATGTPIAIGFTVYQAFEDIGSDGILPMPDLSGNPIGGHAVLVVGWRNIRRRFYAIVRNSWGKNWGDGGYFYMPAHYLFNPRLANDFWAFQMVGRSPNAKASKSRLRRVA